MDELVFVPIICLWNNSIMNHHPLECANETIMKKRCAFLLIQVFDGDIFQIFNSFFADDLDLEIG